jgi:PAS domain-containing protein
MNPLLEAALGRARESACLLPVWWTSGGGTCSCPKGSSRSSPGKHPLTPNGLDDASSYTATITRWWTRWPKANIGERTDNLARIDIDLLDVAEELARDTALPLETEIVLTPRAGLHIGLATETPVKSRTLYPDDGRKLGELKAAREEMMPASDLAEVLTEEYEGWTDADLEPKAGDEQPLVKAVAWKRVSNEKKRELAQLVDDGVLVGDRKGRRLYVNTGSFYDWLGKPVPLFPDWGCEYQVFPDKQADEVRRLQKARRHTQEQCRHAPLSLVLDLPRRKTRRPRKGPPQGEEIAEAVGIGHREGIQPRS